MACPWFKASDTHRCSAEGISFDHIYESPYQEGDDISDEIFIALAGVYVLFDTQTRGTSGANVFQTNISQKCQTLNVVFLGR